MERGKNQHARNARDGDGVENIVGVEDMPNPSGFDAMEEAEEMMGVCDREMWLERHRGDLLDVNEASIFYNDFPTLSDFPCMSSSSSSSSTPAPAKAIASNSSSPSASSSSSAASWAVLRSDAEEDTDKKNQNNNHHDDDLVDAPPPASMEVFHPPPPSGDIDCMDVMETFGYMDLMDSNEIWDPSSIFENENPQEFTHDQKPQIQREDQQHHQQQNEEENDGQYMVQSQEQRPLDELGIVFFEWLKSNKEHISAEDMRSIKLRRATVDCASKRLGSTKEGKKQLLKLILEWVEQYQLQKKQPQPASELPYQYQEHFQNPNPNNLTCNPIPPPDNTSTCFSPAPWMPPPLPLPPPPHYDQSTAVMVAPTAFPPMGGYVGDPYSGGGPVPPHLNQNINGHPNYHHPPSTEYHIIDSAQTWSSAQYEMASEYSPFPENNNNNNIATGSPFPQAFAGYGNQQYPYQYYHQGNGNGNGNGGEKLARLGSSATKEARKKRMARQRRFLSHHRHHHHNHQNQHQNQNAEQQEARPGSENCTNTAQANTASWIYWPPVAVPAASTGPVIAAHNASQPRTAADRLPIQPQNYQQNPVSSDRRQQGWKSEKNLKFLLQKVLKQSDVGNLGRIVLPKKEAETHLPQLDARDGITITMEDIGTSRIWNLRYSLRFWPNNKSRMYLLENTGDFVRANGLQEGDFIVIYSDVKCGKYLIRGVKVRQPGAKAEGKKLAKGHRNQRTASPSTGNCAASPQPSEKTVK
ncbi:unnamed protein product [Camellia sinensis]